MCTYMRSVFNGTGSAHGVLRGLHHARAADLLRARGVEVRVDVQAGVREQVVHLG